MFVLILLICLFPRSQTNKEGSGTMKLGGSLTRQDERDLTVSDSSPHVANIGHMVEVCCMLTNLFKKKKVDEVETEELGVST